VVDLDERSLGPDGQRVDIAPTAGPSTVKITIDDVVVPAGTPIGPALAAVGFSEVDTGLAPTLEVVRPPADAADAVRAAGGTPVSYVLTRLRTDPTDRWRSDPEPTIVRDIELPASRSLTPTITVRLDRRASDAVLAGLLGIDGPQASARLTGVATAAGWAATDGDPATAWQTPFAGAVGATLDLTTPSELRSFTITQPGGEHSTITGLRVRGGGTVVDAVVGAPDEHGTSTVELASAVPAGAVQLEVTAIDPRTTVDRRYGEPVVLPAAISELSIGPRSAVPARLDTGCRDDLVTIDGTALPVRIDAAVGDLVAGAAVTATPCGAAVDVAAGTHRLRTASGTATGLDVDRVVLSTDATPTPPVAGAGPTVTVRSTSRTSRHVTVGDCPRGCWLVLGEGFNTAWSASTAAGDLGRPQLVDGGFNGWWIAPSATPVEVTMRWTAQRPLTVALVVSALAVAGCLALVALDRRRRGTPAVAALARLALADPAAPWPVRWTAAVLWVAASALLVGFGWALVAAVAAAVLVLWLGRPRLGAAVTLVILAVIGAVVVYVVLTERPFPNAGWPARFEWLHGLGLFAAVSLVPAVVTAPRPRADRSEQPSEQAEQADAITPGVGAAR
jgi:arabinofuranan 3-O-arabinosyltransferase